MAFLQIDGLTIPVDTKSPRKRFEEVGAFSRSVSGSGLFGIRSAKRSWDVSTTPMSRDDAEALAELLSGRGLLWTFAGSSPNATNGYVPPTATNLTYTAAGGNIGLVGGMYINLVTAAGTLSIVDATHNPFLGFDRAWSLNVWVYRTVSTAAYILLSSRAGMSPDGVLYTDAAGKIYAACANWNTQTAGNVISNAAWHMLTAVFVGQDDGKVRVELWIDGSIASTATSAAALTFPSLDIATSANIGSDGGATRFQGDILAPLFVPARLTQRWISALYNGALGIAPGSWPLHRVTGTVVGGGVGSAFARNLSAEPVDAPGLVAAERLTFTLSEA